MFSSEFSQRVHFWKEADRIGPDIPISDQGVYVSQEVVLKKGCWIGANTIVLHGITIGENAVAGAGSVITKSIPPKVLAGGNPARIIRNIGG